MDGRHFDVLTRFLAEPGSRRSLLGLPASLPILGGLFALVDLDETDARGRRKRRKKRHKHGKSRRRQHQKRKKPCTPDAVATTCAGGKCGAVTNNCKQSVDCGSCDCPVPCGACFFCQARGANLPAQCVADPDQAGDPCGSDGQSCQANGSCACQAGSCPDVSPICEGGTCVPCTTDTQCQAASLGDHCCSGVCRECCESDDCSGTEPICVSGVCKPCSGTDLCPSGCCDAATGECLTICPTCQVCTSGICQPDATLEHTCVGPCPGGQWCNAGACASIQATVLVTDCGSLCSGDTLVCGESVTCPSCAMCLSQSGCVSNFLPEGPRGEGHYCSQASSDFGLCGSCSAGTFCTTTQSSTGPACGKICPY